MPDTTLDGREAIKPDAPVVDAALAEAAKVDMSAAVKTEVDRQMASVSASHKEQIKAAEVRHEKERTIACLQTYIDGNPGDTLDAVQFRSGVQDLILGIHQGAGDKPLTEFLSDAAKLNEARLQVLKEQRWRRLE